jgi:hypothetical protein
MSWFFNMCDSNMHGERIKMGLINLCKGLFSLSARIYYSIAPGWLFDDSNCIKHKAILIYSLLYFVEFVVPDKDLMLG